jgi:hypothetical protein
MEIQKGSTSALGLAAAKSWFTVTTKVNERNGLITEVSHFPVDSVFSGEDNSQRLRKPAALQHLALFSDLPSFS